MELKDIKSGEFAELADGLIVLVHNNESDYLLCETSDGRHISFPSWTLVKRAEGFAAKSNKLIDLAKTRIGTNDLASPSKKVDKTK